jgi:hypothetical protein
MYDDTVELVQHHSGGTVNVIRNGLTHFITSKEPEMKVVSSDN